jgi:hypothetical protein
MNRHELAWLWQVATRDGLSRVDVGAKPGFSAARGSAEGPTMGMASAKMTSGSSPGARNP